MAFVFNRQFDESTEQKMGAFFQTLSEKDRRRYAAMEAVKLGHGGIASPRDTGVPPEHEIQTRQSASAMKLHGSRTDRLRQFICRILSTEFNAPFANELP